MACEIRESVLTLFCFRAGIPAAITPLRFGFSAYFLQSGSTAELRKIEQCLGCLRQLLKLFFRVQSYLLVSVFTAPSISWRVSAAKHFCVEQWYDRGAQRWAVSADLARTRARANLARNILARIAESACNTTVTIRNRLDFTTVAGSHRFGIFFERQMVAAGHRAQSDRTVRRTRCREPATKWWFAAQFLSLLLSHRIAAPCVASQLHRIAVQFLASHRIAAQRSPFFCLKIYWFARLLQRNSVLANLSERMTRAIDSCKPRKDRTCENLQVCVQFCPREPSYAVNGERLTLGERAQAAAMLAACSSEWICTRFGIFWHEVLESRSDWRL